MKTTLNLILLMLVITLYASKTNAQTTTTNLTNYFKVTTPSGYLLIGPGNTSFSHFITDKSKFYFNKSIHVNGSIHSYEGNNLSIGASGQTQLTILASNGNVGIGTETPISKLQVAGVAESLSAQVVGFGNLPSTVIENANQYRSFSGSAYVDGYKSVINRYFNYRSTYGGYTSINGEYGFYAKVGYPRMFMEVISGNHGTYGNLPADSPIKNGFIYQQIKGPSFQAISTPQKATATNSQWLWGVKADGEFVVDGKITSEEIKVEVVNPPDYVFAPTYNLPTLEATEAYIKQNHHLPEVPSAAEMEANGIELGKMNMLLLQKIEELTLHQIAQHKNIQLLLQKVAAQDKEITNLKNN